MTPPCPPDRTRLPGSTPATTRIERQARVPAELAGERVDRAAAALFPDFSRAVLSGWLRSGELTVDGRSLPPKTRLLGGEALTLRAALAPREDWQTPQPVPFDVCFEDDDLLVLDKPAGVVVHPGAGNRDRTLVNGLLAYRPQLAELPRAGIVHRLDKDTSGLLLVAGSLSAHHRLVQALQARRIGRRYLALVEGCLSGGLDVDRPIGRDPRLRTRQQVREDGKPALTRVRVRERFRAHTLVEATLATGRTHQIRVHLASLGLPLVGDRRYGARGRLPPAPADELVSAIRGFRRQALHAWQLELAHPVSGEPLCFEAPLPGDLQALLDVLAQDAAP